MMLSRRGKEHKHDYYVHQGRFVGERNLLDKNDFVRFAKFKIISEKKRILFSFMMIILHRQ